jgi:hypothetical protein
MKIESLFIVKEDVASIYRKGFLYAKVNDRVKLISEHGNVCIVEKENGERVPVGIEQLSKEVQDPVPMKPSEPAETVSKPIFKRKKSPGTIQADLF